MAIIQKKRQNCRPEQARMKKSVCLWLILIMLICLLPGCTDAAEKNAQESLAEDAPGTVHIFYTNDAATTLVEQEIVLPVEAKPEEKVAQVIQALINPPEGLVSVIPNELVSEWKVETREIWNGMNEYGQDETTTVNDLFFYITNGYHGLTPNRENVFRVGLMKSLIRIDAINSVSLYDGVTNNSEERISYLTSDTVIVNESDENFFKDNVMVKLYFLNESGDQLVTENRTIPLMMSERLQEKIMELLIAGPQTEGYRSALPVDTVVNEIIVQNNVCYLDMDEGFVDNQLGGELAEQLTIYSIVNSMTQGNINSVQFLIDGQTREYYKSFVKINVPLFYNEELTVKK